MISLRDIVWKAALMAASLALVACSRDSAPQPVSTSAAYTVAEYSDPARQSWDGEADRPLATVIWYEARGEAQAIPVLFPDDSPIFDAGPLHRDPPPADGKRPLILVSHGTGSSALQMSWLARRLTLEGFIVAGVNHHGNTAAEDSFDPRGFRLVWERASDLSALLDALLADPQWAPLIDETRIGAAGFSLGGYTVIAAAGGQLDYTRFQAFCASPQRDATCNDQPEFPEAGEAFDELLANNPDFAAIINDSGLSYADPRIRAVAAIAPAVGQALTPESLSNINVPVFIIGGTGDTVTPFQTNAAHIGALIPNADLHEIAGAGHLTFLDTCTPHGRRHVEECKDPPGTDRALVHEQVAAQLSDFFRSSLANVPEQTETGD